MAYAIKYLFKWESVNGTTREIRVLKDGYSGGVIQRHLGRAPVLKKQHNGTVYGTSLEFYAECKVDGEFTEFYTTDPKAFRVDLYDGNTLLWQGYVTPELYSEPDIAPPYDVQVTATDGIGELKLYDFAAQGVKTLRQMFTYLLGYTGLGTDVYLISSMKAGSSGAGALLDKSINLDYKVGDTCYEVLTYLLDTLHATITWWKGAWIVARETNVTFTSNKVRYYNTSGNSALLTGSVVTLGKMYTNDAWPVGQLTQKIDPAKKSVTIQAPWHVSDAFVNGAMDTDTGWTKVNNASWNSAKKGYNLPDNGQTTDTATVAQSISLVGMRVPMDFTGKFCASLISGNVYNGVAGVAVDYLTSNNVAYHLSKDDEGSPTWVEGASGSTDYDFQIRLSAVDTDDANAETLSFTIPALAVGTSYPAGTLTVRIVGRSAIVFSASLDVVISKGYQDRLHIDNGARGEEGTIEVAIGRETSDIDYYKAFMQGLLLDSGSLITSFKDDSLTTATDFLSYISRDYARSFALPRIVRTGKVFLEGGVVFPPLVFAKGAVDYWLETWSWDMYEDEMDISARSLPTASITVESEVIAEYSSGSASSSSSGGGGGGSTPITPIPSTLPNPYALTFGSKSYDGSAAETLTAADIGALTQHQTIYSLILQVGGTQIGTYTPNSAASTINIAKSNLTALLDDTYHPLGGSTTLTTFKIGGATLTWHAESSAGAGDAYLEIDSALLTSGDQIVGDGTPGSGGGGAAYLYELKDFQTGQTRATSAKPFLMYDASATGVDTNTGAWVYASASDVKTALNLNDSYLPLSGGTLTKSGSNGDVLTLDTETATWNYLYFKTGGTTRGNVGYYGGVGMLLLNTTSNTYVRITDAGALEYNDGTTNRTIYHSGNFTPSSKWDSSNHPTTVSGYGITDAVRVKSLNNSDVTLSDKVWSVGTTNKGDYSSQTECPTGYGLYLSLAYDPDKNQGFQIYGDTSNLDNGIYYRSRAAGDSNISYHSWKRVLDESNYSSYALPLTGGMITSTEGNPLIINTSHTAQNYLRFQIGGTDLGAVGPYASVGMVMQGNGGSYLAVLKDNGGLRFNDGTANRTVYHSGNLTKSILTSLLDGDGGYYLPLSGGTLQAATGNFFNLNATSGANCWQYFRVGGTNKASVGYYSGLAFVANETTYARIGVNDAGVPQYWPSSNSANAQTLYHSGNSNKSDVPWTCSTLTASGNVTVSGNLFVGGTSFGSGARLSVKAASEWASYMESGSGDCAVWSAYNGYGVSIESKTSDASVYLMQIKYGQTSLGYGGTTAFYVRADGNVGIGTNAPYRTLDVRGATSIGYGTGSNTIGNDAFALRIGTASRRGSFTYFPGIAFCQLLNYNSSQQYENNPQAWIGLKFESSAGSELSSLVFATKSGTGTTTSDVPIERMTIKSDGNVGIGTSSPDGLLNIAGASSKTLLRFTGPSSYGTNTYNYVKFGADNVAALEILWGSTFKSSAGDIHLVTTNGWSFGGDWNNVSMRFYNDGTLVTKGDQVISSDATKKTNLVPITLTAEQIANAPAISFDWKDGHGHSFGSIAQYWKPLVPEAVLGKEGDYTLAYAQLGTVLGINNGKAIFKLEQHETEQDKEIRELKAKVADQNREILRLKARLGLEN